MSVLTIARNVALSIGADQPDLVTASTEREVKELLQTITETCQDMARRVQWGDLTKTTTLTGDGTALAHSLPSDFDRLTDGVCVTGSGGIIRPLTQGEWAALTMAEGTPRYFLLQDDTIELFPYLASAQTATVSYQSTGFVGGTASAFTDDTDAPIFDERTVELGTVARWKRQKGQPYQDVEAEYEAALGQRASFDNRGRL